MNNEIDISPVFSMLLSIQAKVDTIFEFISATSSKEEKELLHSFDMDMKKVLIKRYAEKYPDVFGNVDLFQEWFPDPEG